MAFLLIVVIIPLTALVWWKLRNRKEQWRKLNVKKARERGWFGRGPKPENYDSIGCDKTIHPFTIDIKEEILIDLQKRLENTRLEEPMDDTQFLTGFNPNYMKEVVAYWKNEYNWREQEKHMNKYPQFTTEIEGLQVHFIHVKPVVTDKQVKVLPLMLLHGWPSNCMEFLKATDLLTAVRPEQNFVFEVVCPSIPGFGFSERPHKEGLDNIAVGRIYVELMNRIGHRKFYVHGGDWGARLASNMARFFPESILGLHITMCSFFLVMWDLLKYVFFIIFPFFLPPDQRFMVRSFWKKLRLNISEGGYFYINATKPDTLGCAMSDSPAGVAAYLLEKYGVATNADYLYLPDGGLTKKYTLDELLNCVMLTWVNNSFAASARFYTQNLRDVLNRYSERFQVTVPSGVSVFPQECLSYPRKTLTGQMRNLVYYQVLPRGGHFIALEEPAMFDDEIRNFVSTVEAASKVN